MSNTSTGSTPPLAEQHLEVNDLDVAFLSQGSGPLALCLHGFPDVAWGWAPVLDALAAAGYHAVAPFARGYAPTAVPPDGRSPVPAWVRDADALHAALGGDEPGVLIGHDWGALAAYGAAALAPGRWRRVVTASIPPPTVMAAHLGDYDQVKRFWYQYVFLQPTAEDLVAADDLAFLDRLWADWSPGYDPTEALAPVKRALAGRANLTAALSTYRALYDPGLVPPDLGAETAALFAPLSQPTLYLHGDRDGCVDVALAEEVGASLPPGSRVEIVAGAGHFLQYERPDTVSRLIVDFLGPARSGS